MFEKVVVCTDLTPDSERLVACARVLRALGTAEVLLTHVVDVFSGRTGDESGVSEMFARQTEELEAAGLRVRVDTPVGHPSYAIEEVADRSDASLILMGMRQRGLQEASFSGSVSSDLVHISRRPILLVPYSGLARADGARICSSLLEHVLLPTDLSSAGERARRALEALTVLGVDRTTVLHVLDRDHDELTGAPRTSAGRLEAGLHGIRHGLGGLGVEIRERVECGPAPDTVLQAANSGEYSLVMVAAPRTKSRLLTPALSVSAALIAGSSTPLLLLPPRCAWPGETATAGTA